MNITISKKDLLRVATHADAIAQRKGTIPAIANVLLSARGEHLTCSATDLFRARVDVIPSEVKTEGAVAIGAHDFAERIKALPDSPIDIAAKDNGLVMKAKGSARKFTLRSTSADDFPPIPKPDDGAPTITLAAGVLAGAIAHTQFAISTDETRAHLNSALVEIEPGLLRMVSTDGHRLSKYERAIDGGAHATMLVPLSAITELRKIDDAAYASGEGAKLTLIHSGATLFVRAGDTTFSVRLVDAVFPPYAQVIPTTTERTIHVPRVPFMDAVKAVSVASEERTGGVRLSFSKGTLRITGESPDRGEGIDEVPYELVDGKDGALIGMAAKYLVDVAGALSSDTLALGISGEVNPMLVRPVGDEGFVGVVMAMRI